MKPIFDFKNITEVSLGDLAKMGKKLIGGDGGVTKPEKSHSPNKIGDKNKKKRKGKSRMKGKEIAIKCYEQSQTPKSEMRQRHPGS